MSLDETKVIAIARSLSSELRQDYLDQVCGNDDSLLRRISNQLQQLPETVFNDSVKASALTQKIGDVKLEAGETVGPYKLLQKVGEGGFGVVFMAEQHHPVRRKVALKVIKPGMDSKEVVARFSAERQALAMMDHPNIAKVLDAGATQSGRPFFVMELVKGIHITEYCDQHRLDTTRRLELFVRVCQAVQHAHQKGIIHRDIKPSNVLVTDHDGSPVPKVIDFGVAKAMNQQLTVHTVFTQFQQMIGTPMYMSPEQAAISGLDVDTRSDIYSLGVLLYELLTGTTPIELERLKQATYDEVRRIIREEEPLKPSSRVSTLGEKSVRVSELRRTDPRQLNRMVKGELDWIVMKALDKDRKRRYESSKAFADDLERFMRHDAVLACPPSTVYRVKKLAQRYRTMAISIATITASLLLATGVSLSMARTARIERDAATEAKQEAIKKGQELQAVIDSLHIELREKVLLAMIRGDKKKAEIAIEQAQVAGVSTKLINFYRGQLELYYGHPMTAIELLSKSADETVAGAGLLYEACWATMDFERIEQAMETLLVRLSEASNQTLTYEDRLFAGAALIDDDMLLGNSMIEEALRELDSPLARLLHAKTLAASAHNTGDVALMRRVLVELRSASPWMGNTPILMDSEFMVMHIGLVLGLEEEVAIDVDELVRSWHQFDELPSVRLGIIRILADVAPQSAVKLIESQSVKTDGEMRYYVPILLQHRTPSQVLTFIDRSKSKGIYDVKDDRARVMALIPSRRQEAKTALLEQIQSNERYSGRINALNSLLLLGEVASVRRLSSELNGRSVDPVRSQEAIMRFHQGAIDSKTLFESAGPILWDQHGAHFAIALNALANGEYAKAKSRLQECLDTKMVQDEDYNWAKALLKALRKEAVWEYALNPTPN